MYSLTLRRLRTASISRSPFCSPSDTNKLWAPSYVKGLSTEPPHSRNLSRGPGSMETRTRPPTRVGPRDVATRMNFYVPVGDDEPYQYVFTPPDGVAHNNLGSESRPVVVHDVRGRESEYSLDGNGFQFVRWPSTEQAFTDPEAIRTKYYAEVEELLKSVTGAKSVFIFDHTIRRSAVTETLDNLGARGPVDRVHVDQTPEASIARVHRHLPASAAARLLASRVRIINVWRPIAHPVAHRPLALADWRTLARDGSDLVPVRLVYPDRVGSTFGVRYSPAMRFYYLADQRPEEVALIKIFDSQEEGKGGEGAGGRTARVCAHSAFEDPRNPPDAPTRQSIEVRAIVFDAE